MAQFTVSHTQAPFCLSLSLCTIVSNSIGNTFLHFLTTLHCMIYTKFATHNKVILKMYRESDCYFAHIMTAWQLE